MIELQREPAKKWYKKRSNILMLATAVIVIGGIVAFAWIISMGGGTGGFPDTSYDTAQEQLQTAVWCYQENNSGTLPTLNGTVAINGSVYPILDVCPLLTSQGGMLRALPPGIWSGNGSVDDNCDNGCEGCSNTSHYIWVLDSNGSVYSTCVGNGCKAQNQDGYQGVWP